jgi:hypothetical protein
MILEVEDGEEGGGGANFEIATRAFGDLRDKIGKKSETGIKKLIIWETGTWYHEPTGYIEYDIWYIYDTRDFS